MQDAAILTFIKDWVWAPLLGLVAWGVVSLLVASVREHTE